MSRGSSVVPLFMVGVATAVIAEMALGLLLYESPGFLAAVTLIIGVELAAFTTGLAAQPDDGERGGRWRWFFAVGMVLIAGFASVAWTFQADLMESWSTRGYSLAALAALPMYGCGLVMAGLPATRGRATGVPMLTGAVVGVALMGTVLLVQLQPFGVYLFAVFCLAVAAFITAGQVARETRAAVRAIEEARRREAEEGAIQALEEEVLSPADLAPDPVRMATAALGEANAGTSEATSGPPDAAPGPADAPVAPAPSPEAPTP